MGGCSPVLLWETQSCQPLPADILLSSRGDPADAVSCVSFQSRDVSLILRIYFLSLQQQLALKILCGFQLGNSTTAFFSIHDHAPSIKCYVSAA